MGLKFEDENENEDENEVPTTLNHTLANVGFSEQPASGIEYPEPPESRRAIHNLAHEGGKFVARLLFVFAGHEFHELVGLVM
jgi:hypothetical protein